MKHILLVRHNVEHAQCAYTPTRVAALLLVCKRKVEIRSLPSNTTSIEWKSIFDRKLYTSNVLCIHHKKVLVIF